jgi:hypothetical protein
MRNQVTLPTGETRSVWMETVEELEAFLAPFCEDGYFATLETMDGFVRISFDQRHIAAAAAAPVDAAPFAD